MNQRTVILDETVNDIRICVTRVVDGSTHDPLEITSVANGTITLSRPLEKDKEFIVAAYVMQIGG